MPEKNEKVDDFITMWKKKKGEGETKTPSVIGDTLNKLEELKNRVQALEKENESLKRSIETKGKIDDVSKKFIQEKVQLEEAKKQAEKKLEEKSNEIRNLESKTIELENLLKEKDNSIKAREKTFSELNSVKDYELKINKLTEENDALHEQLIEKYGKLTIDYVVPVESPKISDKKAVLPSTTPRPLESLCQDLQTELNRYKKRLETIKEENLKFKSAAEKSGTIKKDSGEIEFITKENEALKNKISKLEIQLKEQSNEVQISTLRKESENKIKELQGQLNEKDRTIAELKALRLSPPPSPAAKSPVSDLVEELQGTINRLKISLKEKDNIIEKLKK